MFGDDDIRAIVLERFHKLFIIRNGRCFYIDQLRIITIRNHLQKLLISIQTDRLLAAFLFPAAGKDDRFTAGMTYLGGHILCFFRIQDIGIIIRAEFDQIAVGLVCAFCKI